MVNLGSPGRGVVWPLGSAPLQILSSSGEKAMVGVWPVSLSLWRMPDKQVTSNNVKAMKGHCLFRGSSILPIKLQWQLYQRRILRPWDPLANSVNA